MTEGACTCTQVIQTFKGEKEMTVPFIFAADKLSTLITEGSWDALLLVTDQSYSRVPPDLLEEIEAYQMIDHAARGGVHLIPCASAPDRRLILCNLDGINKEGEGVRLFAERAAEGMRRALSSGAQRPCLSLCVSREYSMKKGLEAAVFGALSALWVPLEAREITRGRSIEAFGIATDEREDLREPSHRAAWVRWLSAIEVGRSIARDITGTEPERMSPPLLADLCKKAFRDTAVSVEVIKDRGVLERDYPLMSAVSRASWAVERHHPRVIRFSYLPPEPSGELICLAGKGITYDTGGADLKTGGHMAGMSRDKGGAGAVIGVMLALAHLKPRHIKVIAEVGAARNSVGADSFVTDEIITSYGGARVRIGNTDAEGRLLLADLLAHLKERVEDPSQAHLLSVATLTGHAYRAVGPYTISIDNDIARTDEALTLRGIALQAASEELGEGVELSRLRREDFEMIQAKSLSEDLISCNSAPSSATPRGHQFPAAFLIQAAGLGNESLAKEGYRFTHIDIGGSAVEGGDWQHGRPTAAPVLGMVSALCPWALTRTWALLLCILFHALPDVARAQEQHTAKPSSPEEVQAKTPDHQQETQKPQEPGDLEEVNLSRGALRPHELIGRGGMVVADNHLASEAGAQVLREGGDAVDAAITTTLMLGVLQPFASGIGGGGFAVIHRKDKTYALDFREVAPNRATSGMYLDSQNNPIADLSKSGALAAAVPGEIAGLYELHKRHGKLPWTRLVEPALRAARDGFKMHPLLYKRTQIALKKIERSPQLSSALLRDGQPKKIGELVQFPYLASTLEKIAQHGARGFYEGSVAETLAGSITQAGGIITPADLSEYRPKVRTVLQGQYRGYTLITMPPPSSGGVVIIQVLKALEELLSKRTPEELGRHSGVYLHALTESLKHAFADRANHMGDPDFTQVPVTEMLSRARIAEIKKSYHEDRTLEREAYGGRYQATTDGGTSHLNVLDGQGNAVALTTTINTLFGSGFVAGETGVLLNNEMDDFIVKPGVPNAYGLVGREANSIRPKKRPLSSMSPTIILRGQEVIGMVGGSGGPTIITGALQVILNLIHFDGEHGAVGEAVSVPRIHHQWVPEQLLYDEGFSRRSLDALLARGHSLKPWPTRFNSIQALWVLTNKSETAAERDRFTIIGASDPDKMGKPAAVIKLRLREMK